MINGLFIPDMPLPESCIKCQVICGLICKNRNPTGGRHELCPLVGVKTILDIDGDQMVTLTDKNGEKSAFFAVLPLAPENDA